ncbi:MAG: hypothetical protein ACREMA_13280, partial [Longimicrobiales bacterium]
MRKLALQLAVCGALAALTAGCFENPTGIGSGGDSRPASLERSSADGQSAVAGSVVTNAPVVVVRDDRGLPVSGITVQFQVVRGGGSLGQHSAITNLSGQASAESWTLGQPGPNEVVARTGSLPVVRFFATGVSSELPPDPGLVPTTGAYQIAVRYLVTASLRQQQAVTSAIARWQTVIRGDLQDIPVNAPAAECFSTQPALHQMTDDMLLFIEFVNIDGVGKTLG